MLYDANTPCRAVDIHHVLRTIGHSRYLAAYHLAAEERRANWAAMVERERSLRDAGLSPKRAVIPVRAVRVAIGAMLMRAGRRLTGEPAPAADPMAPRS